MSVQIIVGDWIERMRDLPDASIQMIGPTSPPYLGLRSYLPAGHPDKIKEVGSEPTPEDFVAAMVAGFREARRVLRPDGVFVLNLGDSMTGSGKGPTGHTGIGNQGRRQGFTDIRMLDALPPKNLLMIPFRVAIALQQDGWILRSVIPWLKRNPMPESVQDRPATAVEYLFLLSKSRSYYWDAEAIRVRQTGGSHARGHAPTLAPKITTPGNGIRNNGSWVASMTESVPADGHRSYRNSDAFFQSWQGLMDDEDGDPLALIVNPMPLREAHFASFPPKLVEPFIKAGTSDKGACAACGAPWVRVVERLAGRWTPAAGEQRVKATGGAITGGTARCTLGATDEVRRYTSGWVPSCPCDAGPPVPQTVLDPFLGSGTTALVADRLGRHAIGIELSPEYADMARRRIAEDAPMLTEPVAVETPSQMPLLEVM